MGLSGVAALVAGLAVAQPTALITLVADTPARADEVMNNFVYLDNRITTLDNRVTSVNASLSSALTARLPAGTIAFFSATTCPVGWSVVPALRGRTVVGLPTGGTVGGTTGAPLANLTMPEHSHVWARITAAANWYSYDSSGGDFLMMNWGDGLNSDGSGIYPTAVDSTSARNFYTAPTSTGMPFLQLLGCSKD